MNIRFLQGIAIRLEKVICSSGILFTHTACNIKLKSRDVAEMNIIGLLRKKVSSFIFTIKMFFKFTNNEFRPVFIDTEIDYCAAQAGILNSQVHKMIMNAFANYSNFNRRCPFLPGEYYVKGLNLRPQHLPSMFPVGLYLINSTAHTRHNEWIYNTSIYISIKYHGVNDFSMG